MQIRTYSPGYQLKRNKNKYFTEWALKFWNLLPWEAVEAAGRKFKKGSEISRFIDIPKGTGTDVPPAVPKLYMLLPLSKAERSA